MRIMKRSSLLQLESMTAGFKASNVMIQENSPGQSQDTFNFTSLASAILPLNHYLLVGDKMLNETAFIHTILTTIANFEVIVEDLSSFSQNRETEVVKTEYFDEEEK